MTATPEQTTCGQCESVIDRDTSTCHECGEPSCEGSGCGDWCDECSEWTCGDCIEASAETGEPTCSCCVMG